MVASKPEVEFTIIGIIDTLYRTASLLRPARCYAPPPPHLRENFLYRVIMSPLHAGRGADLRFMHIYARVEEASVRKRLAFAKG